MAPPTELTKILTPEDIATLKQSYDGKAIGTFAVHAFEATFLPAGDYARAITRQFYPIDPADDQMTPRDRELVMVALLADVPDMNFITHLYIGLMEGLSPALIVNTVYLTALYRGAGLWTEAARVMGHAFTTLKRAADTGGDAAAMRSVLAALRE